MSAKPKTAIQLLTALLLALAAGVLVFRWMQVRPDSIKAPQAVEIMVAVAATDLERGRSLALADLRQAKVPARSLPDGFFTDPEQLTGRVLAAPAAAGQPVSPAMLAPESASGGVSGLVAPGSRAIAVKGNKVMGLAGLVQPGNRVDVLVTLDDESGPRSRAVTKIVLENIRVLATGTELEPAEPGGDPASVDTYTLEMTPGESERLALAATRGTLHFALRNPADGETVLTPGVDVAGALGAYLSTTQAAPKASRPARPAQPPKAVVEVIRGTDRQTRSFQP